MGRQLSPEEINQLITFHYNTAAMMQSKMRPAFDKQQTIQILNAVSDNEVLTADGKWKIIYKKNNTEFFVKPVDAFTPCGHFNKKNALARLSL